MMSAEIGKWLYNSPRMKWDIEFKYLLSASISKTVSRELSGFSKFILGLNAECNEKNAEKAYRLYKQGASKLDPLCLFRLHEIYTGEAFFRKEMNINRAVIYLVFAGIYSQDLDFGDSIIPFKKLKAFLNSFDPNCEFIAKIFRETNDEAINSLKELTYPLLLAFIQIDEDKQRDQFLIIVNNLSLEIQKDTIFTLYLSEFRLPWLYHIERKENLVLKLMQSPEIFEAFFQNYRDLIELACINSKLASKFHMWLQAIIFVLDFAALSLHKKKYYHFLTPFVIKAFEKNLFENNDTLCWLRYFLAYCYEKGIGVLGDKSKALIFIEKNIQESPNGVYYPLRKAILFNQLDKASESQPIIQEFEELYEKKSSHSENTLLLYTRGKCFEKIHQNMVDACDYYSKGAYEAQLDASQNTFFFYSYWRLRCLKRLNKLKQRSILTPRKSVEILAMLKLKTENQVHSTVTSEPAKKELLPESKTLFENLGISVLSYKDPNNKNKNPYTSVLANNLKYYTEEFQINDINTLQDNTKVLETLFLHQNSKFVSPEGISLEEKRGQVSICFMTLQFEFDLCKALELNSFGDIKTKIHIASQIALCLIQIHQLRRDSFYGTLKPKKIILDQYFTVKLVKSCPEMLPYQIIEPDVYIAPEQFEGYHSQSSDIWAFGRILWELLCDHQVLESDLKEGESESLGRIEDLITDMTKENPQERTPINTVYNVLTEIYHRIPRS